MMKKKWLRRGLFPAADSLCVNQLVVYELHCPVSNIVHPLHPQHLILLFELFGHTLTLGHLLRQQEHLLRRLLVDIGKISI